MVCSVCKAETRVRHGIDLRRNVWCCPKCFRVYNAILRHYSRNGYSKERCITILRGVVEKQKIEGKWA
jgi:hypothetical protein